MKSKWEAANRTEDIFLKKNVKWLEDLISSASPLSIKLDGTVQLASNWFQEQLFNLDTALGSSNERGNSSRLRGTETEGKPDNDEHYYSSDDSSEGYFVRSTMTTPKRRDPLPTMVFTKPTIVYYKEVKTTKRDVNARADYDIDSDSDKHYDDKHKSDKYHSDRYKTYNSNYDASNSENSDENKVSITVPIVIETTTKRHKKIEKEFLSVLKHWVHTKTGKKKNHKIQRIQNDKSTETGQQESFNPGLVPPLLQSIQNKTESEAKQIFNELVEKYSNKTKKLHEVQEFLETVKNKTEPGHSIIDKINSTAQGLIDHIKNDTESQVQHIISEMNNTAQHLVENAKNETEEAAQDTYNQFVNQTQEIIQEAINKTETQIEELKNQTGFQIEVVQNKTETQLEEMKNKTENEVDKIKNITETIPDKLEELRPPLDELENIKNETVGILDQNIPAIPHNLSFLDPSPAHKIGQDSMIKAFTDEILQRTLQLFDDVMKRSSEYHWKQRIKELAKGYKAKFREFLTSTKKHTIRTKYGPKKVISNAIDISNRIITRLMEYASNEMEKQGLIYNNLTPKMLQAALYKEKKHVLKRACKQFGLCHQQRNPFLNFITDVTKSLLSVSNAKFETALRSLTSAAKETDFFLGYKTNIGIKKKIKYIQRQNVNVQRGIVMIINNIFSNRNTPIAVSNKDGFIESKLRSTLALHEIINVFDDETQYSIGYQQERDEIKRNLDDWIRGGHINIDTTMTRIVMHIQNVISNLDQLSRNVISENAKLLFT